MKLRITVILTLIFLAIIAGGFPPSTTVAERAPSLILQPDAGPPGTSISITGGGFIPGAAGFIWFDTIGNGIKDTNEPSRAVSATTDGSLPNFTRLTAPETPGGRYQVLMDVPGGGTIEVAAAFTVTPVITLGQKTGFVGTRVTISGSGFAAGAAGSIWYDTDGDGKRSEAEPRVSVTCDGNGTIPYGVTLTTPAAGPGTYKIIADIPGGEAAVRAPFTYTPTLVLSPSPVTSNLGAVIMDTVISVNVSGGGFTPGAAGYIWFDANNNGKMDSDESRAEVTVNQDGSLPAGIVLKTPKLPPCSSFNILADVPEDGQIDAAGILEVAETTTSVIISKHDPYGKIIATKTVSWQWMKKNMPIVGDGKTDYYIQKGTAVSDTFEDAWDPDETNNDSLLEMGAVKGTDVKDLLNLVGGAADGDSVLFTASDGWETWFDARNIYQTEPRQGRVVLAWWNSIGGGYVPDFYLGMRLYCLAQTTSAAGQHIFGDWDMHQTMASSRWQYSPIGGASSRLSEKYVKTIDIYPPNLFPCDVNGDTKSDFATGETVYVKGLGLAKNTGYKLWLQPDGVQVSPLDSLDLPSGNYTLSAVLDPSGAQETVITDASGDFTATAIWQVNITGAVKKWDIVADNLAAGMTGTYDSADSLTNIGWEGFRAPSAVSNAVAWDMGKKSGPNRWIIAAAALIVVILLASGFLMLRRKSR